MKSGQQDTDTSARNLLAGVHLIIGGLAALEVAVPLTAALRAGQWDHPGLVTPIITYVYLPVLGLYAGPSLLGGAGVLLGHRWAARALRFAAVIQFLILPLGPFVAVLTFTLLRQRDGSGPERQGAGRPRRPLGIGRTALVLTAMALSAMVLALRLSFATFLVTLVFPQAVAILLAGGLVLARSFRMGQAGSA
ncbi:MULTISPECIES: hypothetical protein [Chelatococcus]|uniref:Uncharacterized protein n=1 Tax=Chelatococcus caeni TaxID=1348468 RepID=A0A840C8X8_9HYPH|nr:MULTISPECIES: hypothetical protein [Chelatococcus]ALA16835.1 hypothetical protein AL346_04690 [Chelatococcus sp. CO-6]MBB4019849.1 hypothetical protein [Chelatococcus caeni]